VSYSQDSEDSYRSEVIELKGDKYLVHSMYGENYPQDEEALIMHQPLDSLLESQEILIQRELEGESE